jgi:hypothetical protein
MFVTNVQAGVTNLVPIQSSLSLSAGTSAKTAYGMEVLKPNIAAGATISTRGAALYLDDWSVGGNAGMTGGYALYSVGGSVWLGAGDATRAIAGRAQLLMGDGPNITADTFRAVHIEFANDVTAPSVYLKTNTGLGFSYFEHSNDAGKLGFWGLYGSGNTGFSPGSAVSRANLLEMFNSGGNIAFNAFGATSLLYLLANGATGLTVGYNSGPALGFFGAPPVVKPVITGSRGGNAALAVLLTALASLGLVTDATTA